MVILYATVLEFLAIVAMCLFYPKFTSASATLASLSACNWSGSMRMGYDAYLQDDWRSARRYFTLKGSRSLLTPENGM